ncbi:MAG: hypothetical protein AB7E47_06860 [Desulfovibrionaceae bacterium]
MFDIFRKPDKLHEEISKLYNELAFCSTTEPTNDSRIISQFRLTEELVSSRGIRAISVNTGRPYSCAIHQFNKNGSFSTKSPYYISYRSGNWRISGIRHIVQLHISKDNNYGFEVSGVNSGVVREIGVRVIEYDTKQHMALNLKDISRALKGRKIIHPIDMQALVASAQKCGHIIKM